jgi:hypothetical protein
LGESIIHSWGPTASAHGNIPSMLMFYCDYHCYNGKKYIVSSNLSNLFICQNWSPLSWLYTWYICSCRAVEWINEVTSVIQVRRENPPICIINNLAVYYGEIKN